MRLTELELLDPMFKIISWTSEQRC